MQPFTGEIGKEFHNVLFATPFFLTNFGDVAPCCRLSMPLAPRGHVGPAHCLSPCCELPVPPYADRRVHSSSDPDDPMMHVLFTAPKILSKLTRGMRIIVKWTNTVYDQMPSSMIMGLDHALSRIQMHVEFAQDAVLTGRIYYNVPDNWMCAQPRCPLDACSVRASPSSRWGYDLDVLARRLYETIFWIRATLEDEDDIIAAIDVVASICQKIRMKAIKVSAGSARSHCPKHLLNSSSLACR